VEVFVVHPPRRRYWLHILLFALTVLMTMVCGARLQYYFANHLPISDVQGPLGLFPVGWIIEQPSRLLSGLPFALTLMLILFTHEMGHYLYCVRYGVAATLPFFIPFPTFIGTLGAFIRIKSFIRSRDALFDIGIAGPIAGFVVAVAATVVGLLLSQPLPVTSPPSELGTPLIFEAFTKALGALGVARLQVPMYALDFHPVALAAWFGMLATALNLLPGGQLDGGHIVYSVAPRWHRRISTITAIALVPMALFQWAGWLVWVLVIYLSGLRHPQVPEWPRPNLVRRRLALVAVVMLVLTFIPAPFRNTSIVDLIQQAQQK
jgi:membrane-associated protease RseP (regulator of RpoE activity)